MSEKKPEKRSAKKGASDEGKVTGTKKVNTGGKSTHKVKYTDLFINNEWVKSVDGRTFDVINPSTEEKICTVQRAGDADAEKAILAARKVFDDPTVSISLIFIYLV